MSGPEDPDPEAPPEPGRSPSTEEPEAKPSPTAEASPEEAASDEAADPGGLWSRRVRRFRSGWLGALAAGLPALGWLTDDPQSPATLGLLLAGSVLLLVVLLRQGRGDDPRVLSWVTLAVTLAAVLPGLLARPGWTLVLGGTTLGFLSWRRRPARTGGLDVADPDTLPVWGALGPSAALVLAVALLHQPPPAVWVAVFASSGLAALFGLQALVRMRLTPVEWGAAAGVGGVSLLAGALGGPEVVPMGLVGLAVIPLGISIHRDPEALPARSVLHAVMGRPELLLAVSFGLAILVGTTLLSLTAAGAEGPVDLLDAFFTAVSAVCVTGLSVIDVGTELSVFGRVCLVVLIQLGGLGIMTFSTAALMILRRKPSIRHERALADVFVAWDSMDPRFAVRNILLVTAVIEVVGALVLATRLSAVYGMGMGQALGHGLFLAVSAFCNAGFAPDPTSLAPYEGDALVTSTVGVIIFLGALGPFVAVSLRSRRPRVPVAVRLILVSSFAFVGVGAVLFAAFEWNGLLGELSVLDRLHNALFHSVTLRTAGFQTLPIGEAAPVTLVFMMVWMFIGGAPGSTAGGIKTTTFAVILLSVAATVSGRPEVTYAQRRIDHQTFYRAVSIVLLGALAVLGLWTALLLTQPIEPLSALFEAVSALGTVGLTTGATGQLDEVGKILVSMAMFVGRLGPATVLFLFAARERRSSAQLAEIGLPVG